MHVNPNPVIYITVIRHYHTHPVNTIIICIIISCIHQCNQLPIWSSKINIWSIKPIKPSKMFTHILLSSLFNCPTTWNSEPSNIFNTSQPSFIKLQQAIPVMITTKPTWTLPTAQPGCHQNRDEKNPKKHGVMNCDQHHHKNLMITIKHHKTYCATTTTVPYVRYKTL